MMIMKIARSAKNSNTAKHGASMRSLGYVVTDEEQFFEIQCEGVATDLDLSRGLAPLLEMISSRQMMSYKSRVKVTSPETGEVTTVSGLKACWALDALAREAGIPIRLSCLVGTPEGAPTKADSKAKPVNPEWEAFAASLRGG